MGGEVWYCSLTDAYHRHGLAVPPAPTGLPTARAWTITRRCRCPRGYVLFFIFYFWWWFQYIQPQNLTKAPQFIFPSSLQLNPLCSDLLQPLTTLLHRPVLLPAQVYVAPGPRAGPVGASRQWDPPTVGGGGGGIAAVSQVCEARLHPSPHAAIYFLRIILPTFCFHKSFHRKSQH